MGGAALVSCARPGQGDSRLAAENFRAATSSPAVRLGVFPDDGIAPLLERLESAARQLDLYIFELDSADIERRVTDAARRGVRVRAIVEPNPAGRVQQANQTKARLRRAGVHV